jgi:NADPH:quinone reductase-like Zn-dependent oxidoreductase
LLDGMYDVDPRQGSLGEVDAGWFGTDDGTLPIGAPFRPGLDPLPARQHAWAVVKDRWGRPAHGDPRAALRRVTLPLRPPGPDEALGYVLYAGLTYNTIFAARGVPISVFDLHDRDLHVPGSGAVVLVAAVGRETARQGRLKVGELRVLYPGLSDLLSPRAGADPMHADFRIRATRRRTARSCSSSAARRPSCSPTPSGSRCPRRRRTCSTWRPVYKALYDVARVDYDERVFVEGAAGGTGLYAVACSALRGARVTGLVSTEEKGRLVLARGGMAYVNRKGSRAGRRLRAGTARALAAGGLAERRPQAAGGGAGPQRRRPDRRRRVLGRARSVPTHDRSPGAERPARLLWRHQRLHADLPRQGGLGPGGGDDAAGQPAAAHGVLVYYGGRGTRRSGG